MRRRVVAAVLLCVFFASTAANARPPKWCGYYARSILVASDLGERFKAACAWRSYRPCEWSKATREECAAYLYGQIIVRARR